LNKASTTPDGTDRADSFTVTHPFHPLVGQRFDLVVERIAWGEARVFFLEPGSGKLKSLPTAWTSRAAPDPFLHLAAGRTILRLVDLRALAELLHELRGIERASSS
jgi:hypothetical protein